MLIRCPNSVNWSGLNPLDIAHLSARILSKPSHFFKTNIVIPYCNVLYVSSSLDLGTFILFACSIGPTLPPDGPLGMAFGSCWYNVKEDPIDKTSFDCIPSPWDQRNYQPSSCILNFVELTATAFPLPYSVLIKSLKTACSIISRNWILNNLIELKS